MTDKQRNSIIAVLLAIVIVSSFIIGYNSGAKNNIPIEIHDTIWNIDTVEHRIIDTFPYFIVKRDTVVYRDTVPADIDTSEIVKEYLSIHYYEREWKDTNLIVTISDAISENRLIDQSLKYEITRPQAVFYNTTNEYNYSRYLYAGIRADYKGAAISLYFADKRGLYGLGYNPFTKSIEATGAIKIASFKK